MTALIIGNFIALVASLIMVYTGFIKKKETIILVQAIQIALLVISNIVLGGITGAIINGVNFFRNIIVYKKKLTINKKIILIAISSILTLLFNNLGLIGLLPLVCTIVYTCLIDTKDVIKLKWANAFTLFLWFIYDLFIRSYTSAGFDFISIFSNIIGIYQVNKLIKKEVIK